MAIELMEIVEGELLLRNDGNAVDFRGKILTNRIIERSNVILFEHSYTPDTVLLGSTKNRWSYLANTNSYFHLRDMLPSTSIVEITRSKSYGITKEECFIITDPKDIVMFRLKYGTGAYNTDVQEVGNQIS